MKKLFVLFLLLSVSLTGCTEKSTVEINRTEKEVVLFDETESTKSEQVLLEHLQEEFPDDAIQTQKKSEKGMNTYYILINTNEDFDESVLHGYLNSVNNYLKPFARQQSRTLKIRMKVSYEKKSRILEWSTDEVEYGTFFDPEYIYMTESNFKKTFKLD